jgi:ketosteroid isomerase-like protein
MPSAPRRRRCDSTGPLSSSSKTVICGWCGARSLATRFFAAAEEGDLEGLEELLARDVVLRGDGGGKAPALARALHGRARVARQLIAGMRALSRFGLTWRREEVNGQPGALFLDREGRLVAVMSRDVAEGQTQAVSSIVNPDKLRHLGPLADLGALLRERS